LIETKNPVSILIVVKVSFVCYTIWLANYSLYASIMPCSICTVRVTLILLWTLVM